MSGRPCRHADPQAGSVTAFVLVFSAALVVLAGLVFDGGVGLAAKRRAINVAEQAARTGAQELDIDSVRAGGRVRLDRAAARRAAAGYLAQAGYAGTVTVHANRVEVTVRWSQPTTILTVVGIGQFGGTGTAAAVNCRGVIQEEAC